MTIDAKKMQDLGKKFIRDSEKTLDSLRKKISGDADDTNRQVEQKISELEEKLTCLYEKVLRDAGIKLCRVSEDCELLQHKLADAATVSGELTDVEAQTILARMWKNLRETGEILSQKD